ncbi:toxin B [Thiomicrospira aerophila AL3]|uniref:Toxin B n=1 Tax=Thiomicrospira aerophila AL3 TaxID=717772 RepID=W0DVG4_9GAMM|nr:type II toxin-antitoxin system ChpB family toxin [Thiomicrospira aerophila]AHF01258.1 toxin B [Thiomicrospira aerophila AL3]
MVKRIYDRGDIVRVCLNPMVGNETQGDFFPCIVLSPKAFNALGLAMVAPTTQVGNFARHQGFAVPLSGMQTQGVVLVNGIKSLDLSTRQAKYIETANQVIIDECLARLHAILD